MLMESVQAFLERKVGLKESRTIIQYLPSIIVLSIVTLLSYFYYNAFSPILPILASEFGFNDEDRDYYLGSRLNTIFFIIGGPSSLIFSFLADSNSRKDMFIFISLFCHLSSFFVTFITSYKWLYIWRGLSGALITSTLPLYVSILGDVFPNQLRSVASVTSSVVVGCGMLLGQTLSGYVASRYGWRAFFGLFSSLGLISVALLYYVQFPKKGEVDGLSGVLSEKEHSFQPDNVVIEETMELEGKTFRFDVSILRDIFSVPSNWILFLQGLPGSIPWGVYNTYLHTILCTEKHLSIDTASILILVFGVGAALGSGAAGVMCNFLCSFNKSLLPVGVGIAFFLVLPLLYSFFQVAFPSFAVTLVFQGLLLFLIGLLLSIPGPCIRTMLMNVNKPQCRSTVIAISEVFNNLGKIIGPLVFVYACKSRNRIESVFLVSEFFYVSAALCFSLYVVYYQDDLAVSEYIASVRKEIVVDVENTPSLEHIDDCETISPNPDDSSPRISLPIKSLLSARDGVNTVIKKVASLAMSGVDHFSQREVEPEVAPLLVK